jgi:hypothetical protein
MPIEKEWEIRRLAARVLHIILTEAGNLDDAKLVTALSLSILLNPAPMPAPQRVAELVKLVICV